MCFHPLPSYQISDSYVKVFPRDTAYIYFEWISKQWISVSFKDAERFSVAPTSKAIPREWLTMLPCGKCLDCRLAYARDWANRCIVEALQFTDNYFLTITYDNANIRNAVDFNTGEVLDHGILYKADMVQFLKSLRLHWSRKYDHDNIRFFLAGEYGDTTMRPHYHMIAFNLPLFDLKRYKESPLGDLYYTSEELNKIWHKGYIVVGSLTRQSAAYTARYCLKKIKDAQVMWSKLNLTSEFTNCSRRPGIGRDWYEKNKNKLFTQGFVSLSDGENGFRLYPGRYYKRLYKDENEADYNRYVEVQTYKATVKRELELLRTDLNEIEYDLVKESNLDARTKILFERSSL